MTNPLSDAKEQRYLRYEDGKVFWQYPDGSHRGISEMDVIGINALSEHVRAAAGTEHRSDVKLSMDEQGRPMTYWGGKVDASTGNTEDVKAGLTSDSPVALETSPAKPATDTPISEEEAVLIMAEGYDKHRVYVQDMTNVHHIRLADAYRALLPHLSAPVDRGAEVEKLVDAARLIRGTIHSEIAVLQLGVDTRTSEGQFRKIGALKEQWSLLNKALAAFDEPISRDEGGM